MKNSDFIIEWVKDLKQEMQQLQFKEDDVRLDFFGLINDSAYCYYRSYLLFEISALTNQQKLDFGPLKNNEHIKAIEALSKKSMSNVSHFNSLNRNLILDVWSTFEICINTFCDGIIDKKEKEKLLDWKYRDIIKSLPKNKFTDLQLEKLKSKLQTKHLTHVPIVRKTDFIFKQVVGYSRNIEEDKEFLSFFGQLRNTMHSNYIYYGKSFEYSFGNAKFKFEDGKTVKWYDPFNPTPKLYFYLMGNLKNIWKALIISIKFDSVIYYPDLDQE